MSTVQAPTFSTAHVACASQSHGCNDTAFVDLLAAYRASGGLARAIELPALRRSSARRTMLTVAALIDAGEAVHIEWGSQSWLPLFQFCRPGYITLPALPRAIAALSPTLDSWGIALWFARPNPWLAGARPADIAATRGVQVACAAMADGRAFAG